MKASTMRRSNISSAWRTFIARTTESSTICTPPRFPIWPVCTRHSSSGPARRNSTARRFPIYIESQSPTHINTGIARIKLGRTLLRQHRYGEAEAETHAGYDILRPQMDSKVSWLMNARKDLAEEYEGMKQPEQAAKFRAEIAATDANSPANSAKK